MMKDTLDYIETYTDGFKPEIGIVLGSGLGELADKYCEFAIPLAIKFRGLQSLLLKVIKDNLFLQILTAEKL